MTLLSIHSKLPCFLSLVYAGYVSVQQLPGARHQSVHCVRNLFQKGMRETVSERLLCHIFCFEVLLPGFYRSLSENTRLAEIIGAVAALEKAFIKDTGITSE